MQKHKRWLENAESWSEVGRGGAGRTSPPPLHLRFVQVDFNAETIPQRTIHHLRLEHFPHPIQEQHTSIPLMKPLNRFRQIHPILSRITPEMHQSDFDLIFTILRPRTLNRKAMTTSKYEGGIPECNI